LNALKGSVKLQAKFLGASLLGAAALKPLFSAAPDSYMGRYLSARPETAGLLIWPYQCAAWDRSLRIARFASHFDAIEAAPQQFQFGVDDKLMLLDLAEYMQGCSLVLDQPRWMAREGQLTLNLFQGRFRAFSITFSLFEGGRGTEVFIGGIQGRNTDDALERYRHLTKGFFGLRPRDLAIELLTSLAPVLRATRIYAVADNHRFFRHGYFKGDDHPIYLDYDSIWKERGGIQIADTHFELPMTPARRDIEEVASNKRSMYRKRYEALDKFRDGIRAADKSQAVSFEAL
jgi:uncharacterized protein VirK/YbjX